MKQRLTEWGEDIVGGLVGCLCWFTPAHCDGLAKVIALLIGIITLFFITLPKAWMTIKMYRSGREK